MIVFPSAEMAADSHRLPPDILFETQVAPESVERKSLNPAAAIRLPSAEAEIACQGPGGTWLANQSEPELVEKNIGPQLEPSLLYSAAAARIDPSPEEVTERHRLLGALVVYHVAPESLET